MNRPLVLETPVETPDGAGGVTRGWQALGTLWAGVSGSAREVDGVPVASLKITLRATPFGAPTRPVAGQRLRDGTRLFRIQAVLDGDRVLTCIAEEVQ